MRPDYKAMGAEELAARAHWAESDAGAIAELELRASERDAAVARAEKLEAVLAESEKECVMRPCLALVARAEKAELRREQAENGRLFQKARAERAETALREIEERSMVMAYEEPDRWGALDALADVHKVARSALAASPETETEGRNE